MLKINNLSVKTTSDISILKDINLEVKPGEVHVLMGPNGSGKSTLSKVIMGHYDYVITKGSITFNKQNLKDLTTDERARMGLFLSMQAPIQVEGVTNREFLRTAVNANRKEKVDLFEFAMEVEKEVEQLEMDSSVVHRFVNKDFSGGERKKNEVLQLKILKPKLLMLDELDSGLDVDSLKVVTDNINNYLNDHQEAALIIITHYPKILQYLKPNYIHILKDGHLVKSGGPELANIIDEKGYQYFGETSNED